MIQPIEMKQVLPIELGDGIISTTANVWKTLVASYTGDLEVLKQMVSECPALAYGQYNYTPPIHFAVREGHLQMVQYLLGLGALDPAHITYPFKDSLTVVADDRNYTAIADSLQVYLDDPALCRYRGDNGAIHYNRTDAEREFEEAVDQGNIKLAEKMIRDNPGFVNDPTFFWSEGILMMPAKDNNYAMAALLMRYGARVPAITKWGQYYYFKHYDMALFLMENGMSPHHMTWHKVTLLHDMAQKADIPKAALLVKYGAELNSIEEEYQSTPLGLAVRWGHSAMVEFLLEQGADPNKSGAVWSTPLAWAKRKKHTAIETLLVNAGAA